MAANAQDDIEGQLPRVQPGEEINFLLSFHSQQGDDNQEILNLPQEEHSIHPQPVQASSSEATSEHPAYLPSGLLMGVNKYEEIKRLEERISILEEDLQKEKCNHMEEVAAIEKEMSKVEQELNVARSQLQQTTRDKDNMADCLRAKEAEGCAKDEQLRAKQSELRAKDEQMKVKEAELQVKDEQGKAKDILLQAKDERIKAKDECIKAKDEHIKAKGAELCAKDDLLKAKESEVRTKDEQLKGKDEELSAKDEQMKQLHTMIEQLQAKYTELSEQQKSKDSIAKNHFEKLEREKFQLEKELKSKKDIISKFEKAKDEAAKSLQVQGAESQITSSTSNTGVNTPLPQNDHNNGSVVTAGRNDPGVVVLPGPSVTFQKYDELGRGAFATVYKGKFNNECCAVKILNQVAMHLISDLPAGPPDDPIQRKAIQSFTRECGCLMTINHPNVVRLLDIRTYDKGNFPILIMERLDCSLTGYYKDHPNQNMEPSVQLSICCNIASALDYLHAKKIVHRDICGNNILLVLDDQSVKTAKVSDFGMSRILKDFEGMSTTLTAIEGHRAAYYPPELQDECGSSDSSIDIYMFGVLMLQIAHGIPYVIRRERGGLIQKLSERHILKTSIMWCTELEKNRRPSATSIHESIKSLLEKKE